MQPDFLIAAMGRSGSTMIANWLTRPPGQLVLIEPFLLALHNPQMLHRQFEDFGIPATADAWEVADADWQARFKRLFAPRLAGRRWAVKEVLGEEHRRFLAAFAPPRVVITVRNIADIAASFLEKHRLQGNRHRFDAGWVAAYCRREASAIVALKETLAAQGTPHRITRYEDFVASAEERTALADFTGWAGGGEVARHLDSLGRSFEAERHGSSGIRSGIDGGIDSGIGSAAPSLASRGLEPAEVALVAEIAADCAAYSAAFGYS
jgi:hypothetical protein